MAFFTEHKNGKEKAISTNPVHGLDRTIVLRAKRPV